jgi:hypothetical protein
MSENKIFNKDRDDSKEATAAEYLDFRGDRAAKKEYNLKIFPK